MASINMFAGALSSASSWVICRQDCDTYRGFPRANAMVAQACAVAAVTIADAASVTCCFSASSDGFDVSHLGTTERYRGPST